MLIFGRPLLLALHRGQLVWRVLLQGYLQLLCALLILSEPTSTSWLHWSLEHSQRSFPDVYIALGHWVEVYPKLENHLALKEKKTWKEKTFLRKIEKFCASKEAIYFPINIQTPEELFQESLWFLYLSKCRIALLILSACDHLQS